MEIDTLKKEDLERLINSEATEIHDILKVAKEEFDVDIVLDDSLTKKQKKESIIDQIYDAYNTAIVEVEQNKFKEKVEKRTRTRKSKSKNGKLSAKQFIINLVSEGKHTKKGILKIVDEEYGYTARGKSPKTRVSKTLRGLKDAASIKEAADGTLSLKK